MWTAHCHRPAVHAADPSHPVAQNHGFKSLHTTHITLQCLRIAIELPAEDATRKHCRPASFPSCCAM